jgi:hypothetical protein
MDYDWNPTASRTATPTGGPAVRPSHSPSEAETNAPSRQEALVAAVVEEFVAEAEDGRARNRNGRRYKPSALRDLAGALRLHVVPELGDERLRDVQWQDLQGIVDELAAAQLSVSRIRSVVSAIRALYAYAIEKGIVEVSTADGLEVPRENPQSSEDTYEDTYGDAPWAEDDAPVSLRSRAEGWRDAAEEAWNERSSAGPQRGPRRAEPRPRNHRGASVLPERVLSIVLRLILVVFLLVVLASIAQALLIPA